MFVRTGDPEREWDNYQAAQEKALKKLPKCYECGEPIQGEVCYEINDELVCPDCLNENHRKFVEDYAE